jgi:hypothetical protein
MTVSPTSTDHPPDTLPTDDAYDVGVDSIQYTLRGISPELDGLLRNEAKASGKSLNALVIETLEQAKLSTPPRVYDDLDWFPSSPVEDGAAFDAAQEWLDALPWNQSA